MNRHTGNRHTWNPIDTPVADAPHRDMCIGYLIPAFPLSQSAWGVSAIAWWSPINQLYTNMTSCILICIDHLLTNNAADQGNVTVYDGPIGQPDTVHGTPYRLLRNVRCKVDPV